MLRWALYPARIVATLVTACTLALLPVLPASAQETPGVWHLGLRGGLASANFWGNDAGESGFRPGFSGGLTLTYDANEALSLQPEVLYTRKGSKDFGPQRSRIRYDYLEVPVLVKLSAPLKPITPRLYAGPSVGYLLSAETSGQNVLDDTRRFDVGGVVGGELALDLSRFGRFLDEVALDGRYNLGFLTVDDVTEAEIFNNSFSGKLSLRFRL